MRPLLALALALPLALAGCTGGSDDGLGQQAAELIAPGPTADELARMPGSIEGVVHTVSLAPIASATVRLVRENVSTTTDAGGFFRFADLPTTSYLIEASADGFVTRTIQAAARNGTIIEVNITLEDLVVVEPRKETRELAGYFSCGVLVATEDGTHGADCAAADPNHRDAFEFDVAPDGKNVVLELSWDVEANPGIPRLRLAVETVGYGAMDEALGETVGEGYARLVVPQPIMDKYYPEGGRLRALVDMAPDGGTPPASAGAAANFTLYVTTFYVEPGSDDYTVLGA